MVLNLSPLAAHLQESLTSLRFATKVSVCHFLSDCQNAECVCAAFFVFQVNNTTIGTAKKYSRSS